jgi:hypothetical protein
MKERAVSLKNDSNIKAEPGGHSPAAVADRALAQAALEGDARGIRLALEQGADPNAMTLRPPDKKAKGRLTSVGSGSRVPALASAAMAGCVDGVKALLDAGADPRRRADFGATPIYLALMSGQAECVQTLGRASGFGPLPGQTGSLASVARLNKMEHLAAWLECEWEREHIAQDPAPTPALHKAAPRL